ncbi:ABC transporter substrate-binding protein [Granulosicoccaceae sp. 1_MG-2023]|nr:ABC transporter substrate-binding protein [Granulosicoccaceae sp. 1_MG-2023]
MLRNLLQAVTATCLLCLPGLSQATLSIPLAYLKLETESAPVLSNILPEPEDAGLQGVQLAISDSNTTGRFLKHEYRLESAAADSVAALITQAQSWLEEGIHYFVLDMPAAGLREFAAHFADEPVLLFNAGSRDTGLRSRDCPANTLHTRPSDAMLADALGQWYVSRKQKNWFLISGSRAQDNGFADALRRTAKRYGITLVADKAWTFDTDLRRTAAQEMPAFTRADDYDAVVVADVAGDFGEYVLHNTWLPRPVAGTQGLMPLAWHRSVEQWGAAQLQKRFEEQAGRWMNSADYAAWAAVRSVAEAVTRTNSAEPGGVLDYLMSDDFELAGFKGRKLSYRRWNGQLRQPVPLVHPRALVAQAPLDGFLHPETELDTLGLEQRESDCALFVR